MALTQSAVNACRLAVNRQATILETGLGLLNAQTAKKEIPNFTGEIEVKLAHRRMVQNSRKNSNKCGMERSTHKNFVSFKNEWSNPQKMLTTH
jgi:hypothetical protein